MRKAVHKAFVPPMQAQLAEERGRRGALEAEARSAREAARTQQASACADVERLRECLQAAERATAASNKIASDISTQMQVRICFPVTPSLSLHSAQAMRLVLVGFSDENCHGILSSGCP